MKMRKMNKKRSKIIMVMALAFTMLVQQVVMTDVHATAPPAKPLDIPQIKVIHKSEKMLHLDWQKVNRANQYRVYRSLDGKTWKRIAITSKSAWKDTKKLKANTKYYYLVRAEYFNDGSTSHLGPGQAIWTNTRLARPTLKIAERTPNTVKVTWKKVKGATKYRVYYSTTGKKYKKIGTTKHLYYNRSKLAEKKKYYIKVAAIGTKSGKVNMSVYKGKVIPKFSGDNFWKLGLSAKKLVAQLDKHDHDGYYLGTQYKYLDDASEAGLTRPNGYKTSASKGMNCAGWIATAFRDAGANLGPIRKMGYDKGGANAINWIRFIKTQGIKYYSYRSLAGVFNSGRLKKGDLICRIPDSFDLEKNIDYHMTIFWGSNSHQNRVWHSTIHYGINGNQLTPFQNEGFPSTYIIVPLKR